ncbi:MAG: uroporphyrinogen-III synthase [Alphaproteobacteria bacterium]
MIDDNTLMIITRPDESGQVLLAQYLAEGYQALHLPVMAYQSLMAFDKKNIQQKITQADIVAFTSANGVRAFADIYDNRLLLDTKICAVGVMTGEAIKKMFQRDDVYIAGGNVEKLAEMIIAMRQNLSVKVIHIGASGMAGEGWGADLVHRLNKADIAAEKIPLYDMVALENIDAMVVKKIKHHCGKKIILFFSPRTVALAVRLLKKYDMVASDFIARGHSEAVATIAQEYGFQME